MGFDKIITIQVKKREDELDYYYEGERIRYFLLVGSSRAGDKVTITKENGENISINASLILDYV